MDRDRRACGAETRGDRNTRRTGCGAWHCARTKRKNFLCSGDRVRGYGNEHAPYEREATGMERSRRSCLKKAANERGCSSRRGLGAEPGMRDRHWGSIGAESEDAKSGRGAPRGLKRRRGGGRLRTTFSPRVTSSPIALYPASPLSAISATFPVRLEPKLFVLVLPVPLAYVAHPSPPASPLLRPLSPLSPPCRPLPPRSEALLFISLSGIDACDTCSPPSVISPTLPLARPLRLHQPRPLLSPPLPSP